MAAPDPASEQRTPPHARRIHEDSVEPGRAYLIHARSGGIGVAVLEDGGSQGGGHRWASGTFIEEQRQWSAPASKQRNLSTRSRR